MLYGANLITSVYMAIINVSIDLKYQRYQLFRGTQIQALQVLSIESPL